MVARALFDKGATLGQLDRPEEEVATYDELLTRFGEDLAPELREPVAKALNNKADTLEQLDRREEAVAAHQEIARRFGNDPAFSKISHDARQALERL